MARVLGIDYGTRRIGMAISDPNGTVATPLPTLVRRRGKRPPVSEILRIAKELGAEEIVVGLPLTSEGEEDDWTREVREFGDRLGTRSGLPIRYVDERMTSAMAERVVRASGLRREQREQKARVDAVAAVLILQAHLDRRDR